MKQNVLKRLGFLEERHAAAISAKKSEYDSAKALAWLRAVLRLFKTEQGPNESLMDALARCLGIGSWELRQMLSTPDEFKRVVLSGIERTRQAREAA
jgi:hypothetical protein